MPKEISEKQTKELLQTLKSRFEQNKHRHINISWEDVEPRLVAQPSKLKSLHEMEITGGEPDVVDYDKMDKTFLFCDCAPESPKGRRSVCYDNRALESRKKYKPKNSAVKMAEEMGVELLDEKQYHNLQRMEKFDRKTSSWIFTPDSVRELGGALFGDHRFGRVFIYHNGAESYYAARGFRGFLKV